MERSNSTFNGPSKVEAEAHLHFEIGAKFIPKFRVPAVVLNMIELVYLCYNLQEGKDSQVCQDVHLRDGLI